MKKMLLWSIIAFLLLTGCSGKSNNNNPVPDSDPVQAGVLPQTGENEETDPDSADDENREPELTGALLVMIDNLPRARPQAGLDKADIVYEMMAEAGITRLMALFYRNKADKIGPVRSARHYFVELACGYDAPLAHAGGSQDSLEMIQDLHIKDLDEIYNAGNFFWRDNRKAKPHNLYTSTDLLIAGAKAKGYKLVKPTLLPAEGFLKGEAGERIGIDYSTGSYKYRVSWQYNGEHYERSINNKYHLTEDGKTIITDNAIVLTARTKTIVKDGIPLSFIDIVGRGEARYFVAGKTAAGSWEKKTAQSPLVLYDEEGNPARFKEGTSWIQVVDGWDCVSFE